MEYRIKEILKDEKISILEFSKKLNMQRETLSRIINGASTTVDTLEKIATALNVSVKDLFDDEKEGEELTALIDYKGELYKAKTVSELEDVLGKIKGG